MVEPVLFLGGCEQDQRRFGFQSDQDMVHRQAGRSAKKIRAKLWFRDRPVDPGNDRIASLQAPDRLAESRQRGR